MEPNNLERRLHIDDALEFRDENDNSIVRGYGAVFNKTADLGRFTEEIMPGAFDSVLHDHDVVFVFQHNTDNILARSSSGTLRYGVDERGLWYEASLPNTTLGNDMRELMRRGDIRANSFAFGNVIDRSEKRNGKLHRIITKIGMLHDISLVTHPAYKEAEIVRSAVIEQAMAIESRIEKSKLLTRLKY